MMNNSSLLFVALVGNVNQASLTHAIAYNLDELAPDDVEVCVLPSVGNLPYFDEDLAFQDFPPGLDAMGGAIKEADAVVIVSPAYNGSFPGVLKNALDWLGGLPSAPFAGKAVAIQTASRCLSGGLRAQCHLRQTLMSLDATVLNRPDVNIPDVAAKVDMSTGNLWDVETRKEIMSQLAALAVLSRRSPEAVSRLLALMSQGPAGAHGLG